MPKKIYDIMPPKMVKKNEPTAKSLEKGTPKKRHAVRRAMPVHRETQKRGFPLKESLIGGGVICLLLGIYFYNSLARVTIDIYPKTEVLSFQEKITADKSYENVNLLKGIIPARLLFEEKQVSEAFEATGSASNDGKASGTIKVYNKISPSAPLTLKVGTHFLSDNGKYFISLDRIIIPAMQKNTAGFIDVKVQAKESGGEYNIGASKFSVPGLSGTSYYYSIWAESNGAMSGGYTGKVKKVTKDDILSAKEVLTKKLLDETEALLKSNILQDEVLLDGAFTKNVISASADLQEGTVAEKFNETVKVKVSALVFKKDDLQKFVKLDAQSKLPEGKELLEKSLEVSFTPDLIDMQLGIERIDLKVSATSYYFIDNTMLSDAMVQKSSNQIRDTIDSQYGNKISLVKINFWPFWVTKAPKDKNKIKIELHFE